jgi:carboxyl-terminal processing protease
MYGRFHDSRSVCGGPLILAGVLLGVGCAPSIEKEMVSEPLDCSLTGRLQYVEDRMTGEYLWAEHVVPGDAAAYDDPTEYLHDLRYDELDRWSYARDLSEATDWFEEGSYVGAGYILHRDADDIVRFALVYPDGPAWNAGIRRGDQLLAINGEALETLTSSDAWSAAFGPVEDGAVVDLEVWSPFDTESKVAEVVLAEVVAPPILGERVFTAGDRTIGYFMLTSFIEPAHDALDVVFEAFSEAGVDTVFVDVRYNGGGLLAVGRHLASLVAPAHVGEVYQRYWYNERYASNNTETYLEEKAFSLEARDVVVFTTGSTASASEIVAFALEPYVPVSRMGSTTAGKPVGMNHFEACDLFVAPITFQMGNRDNRASYFDGLAPDCDAADDLLTELGSDNDPMVAAAVSWLGTGACPATDTRMPVSQLPVQALDPWSALRGGGAW